MLVDRPLDPRVAATLRAARDVGMLTLAAADVAEDLPVAVDARLRLGGETGDQAVLAGRTHDGRGDSRSDCPGGPAARGLGPGGLRTGAHRPPSCPAPSRLLDLPSGGLGLGEDGTA